MAVVLVTVMSAGLVTLSPPASAVTQTQIDQLYSRPAVSPYGQSQIINGMLVHYQNAAAWARTNRNCNLPWSVVAAIGKTESNHNSNAPLTSSAGAQGPMQFLPSTWAAYGIDGNGDGVRNVFNPADATAGAANLLCAVGGGSPSTLRSAITQYAGDSSYPDIALAIAWDYSAPGGSDPVGNFELAGDQFHAVRVAGWAADADAGTAPIHVHVYIDGVGTDIGDAALSRGDVGAAYPAMGPNHGFDTSIPASVGPHNVCAYAINVGGGTTNPLLGGACRSVYVGHEPGGNFEFAGGNFDAVHVQGWAADSDAGGAPIDVHVYIDGVGAGILGAVSGARPDVGNAYPEVGANHGFDAWVPTTAGAHTVCAYAINAANTAGGNTLLGCRSATVSGDSTGNLDLVQPAVGGYHIAGWAIDPQGTNGTTDAHIYINGIGTAIVGTPLYRPDVAAAFPRYAGANHGFDTTVAGAAAPTNTLCAYAYSYTPGTSSQLRCQTFTGVNPTGNFEAATNTAVAHQVRLSGWALDADLGTTATDVHIYVDNVKTQIWTATGARADVGNAFPASGPNHGFNNTLTLTAGSHNICAYTINGGPGTNTLLSCKTLTVT